MQKFVNKIAILGQLGVILVIVTAAISLTGIAAITIALVTHGSSMGMMRTIAIIGIAGLIAAAWAKLMIWVVNQINTQQSNMANSIFKPTEEVIKILEKVPGMTFANERDFHKSRPIFMLRDKTVVRTWKNPVGVDHIFLANRNGKIIFGGFVGWVHADHLKQAINRIRENFT